MGQYDAVATRTLAAITKKGAAVLFGVAAGNVYNPLTDTWSGGTVSFATGRAVEIPGDPNRFQALGLVLTNPVTLLVAAQGLTIEPAPGMSLTWGGVGYTIMNVDRVAPDGETLLLYTVIAAA